MGTMRHGHRKTLAVLVLTAMLTFSARGSQIEDEPEPDVEPSALERHEFSTHSSEGSQYDFVQKEAQDHKKQRDDGVPTSELLGQSAGSGSLLHVMKQIAETMNEHHKRQRQQPRQQKRQHKVKSLPTIPADTPVSELLRRIRLSLEAAAPEPSAADASRPSESDVGADDGFDEDDDLAFIDHLDASGLKMLESNLRRQLRRVQRRLERRTETGAAANTNLNSARTARAHAAAAHEATHEAATTAAAQAAAQATATAAAPAGGVEGATTRAVDARAAPDDALARLERALASVFSSSRDEGATDDADEDDNEDETARYESRLAREAAKRERAESTGESADEDGEDGEDASSTKASPLHEALAKLLGAEADGHVYEMKIAVLGGDEEAEDGRPVEIHLGAANGKLAEVLAKAAIRSDRSTGAGDDDAADGTGDDDEML